MIPLCLPRQVHAILTTNYSIALPLWDSPQALNAALHHATCALNWACIALGASVQRKVDDSRQFVFLAKQHLRYCYDVPTYESIMALLAVALVSFQIEPQGAFIRYANMAIILYVEIYETLSPAAARQVCAVLEYTHKLVYTERQFAHRQTPGLDDLLDKYAACNIDRWPTITSSPCHGLEQTIKLSRSVFTIWDCNIQTLLLNAEQDPERYRTVLERTLAEGKQIASFALELSPTGAFFVLVALLLPCFWLEDLEQASRISKQCLELVEQHHVILMRFRKGTVPGMLIDIIELLGDDDVRRRIPRLRMLAPSTDIVEGLAGDNEEALYHWLKQELMTAMAKAQPRVPPPTLSTVSRSEDAAAVLQEYLEDTDFDANLLQQLQQALTDNEAERDIS
jgi:hypothetical protein